MAHPDNLELFARAAGIAGPFLPELQTLQLLHRAWPQTIPFENIDVLLNRPVSVELAAIAEKLLINRRGGYCFEHNLLFKQILEEVGFAVTPHLARVVWGLAQPEVRPQTHMLLIVTLNGSKYLADVGFGSVSLTAPLRLEEGEQDGLVLERINSDQWLLSLGGEAGKKLMYVFEERQCEFPDILVANHFVATHESSLFCHNLVMAGLLKGEQYNLFNQHLTIHGCERAKQQTQTLEEFARVVSLFFSRPDVVSDEDMRAIYAKVCLAE
ncbi:arylamine N-acetyltransferase family protein [Pantoea sp. App145]|uniref:arylamine N-acetyltransferase family protein n=1 Tax=Pantoea sp. App145 TaxID=3071567 RepID=UPI003A80DC74